MQLSKRTAFLDNSLPLTMICRFHFYKLLAYLKFAINSKYLLKAWSCFPDKHIFFKSASIAKNKIRTDIGFYWIRVIGQNTFSQKIEVEISCVYSEADRTASKDCG